MIPTSNHNYGGFFASGTHVVYLLIPTSNHNRVNGLKNHGTLYIFWFLHQTTTLFLIIQIPICCISFDSYIKPQPLDHNVQPEVRCISFDSYIKPQQRTLTPFSPVSCISFDSYIKPQLVQSLKHRPMSCISFDSYIKPQLGKFLNFFNDVVYLLIPTSNHNYE